MSTSQKEKIDRALKIFSKLDKTYPDARTLLDYKNPFELLIATILAAQCTDERVNIVTKELFKKYPNAVKMAKADIADLETLVKSTGFFHAKAKSIKNVSIAIMEKFAGKMPEEIDELVNLPGVGRKTANVVAGNCFGKPAIIVDTHFLRVTRRLGLAESENPDKIEEELRQIVPEKNQTRFSQVVNFHGRNVCKARKPLCPQCIIDPLCPFEEKMN
jgi:endonuclease III